MGFETNVFVNCPFDEEYKTLLQPLLFSILYFGFEPQISQTQSSANIRINQIKKLIRESKFSIHDLSRSRPIKDGDFPRFNMPYELGLDAGCIEYGAKKYKEKKILILEADRFHYQRVLSDIAGQDIENHDNEPAILLLKVRNWFSAMETIKSYPSASTVLVVYNHFYKENTQRLLDAGFTNREIEAMPVGDFVKFSKDWIRNFTKSFPQ